MIAAICRVTGKLSLSVRAVPCFIFKLASPFNETLRELYAMRPLWETPIDLDNTRLVEFLGKRAAHPAQWFGFYPMTPNATVSKTVGRLLGCGGVRPAPQSSVAPIHLRTHN